MKLNPLSSSSRSILRRAPQLAACGALAFGLQVACSDAPANPSLPLLGTSGSTTTTGGQVTTGTAGMTTTAAGTFTSTAGTFSSAGTGTGGADTAGTGGQVTGGTGGSDAAGTGTAGTGGQVVATPYCQTVTKQTLPYPAEKSFIPFNWSAGPPTIDNAADTAPCMARVSGVAAENHCMGFTYTPQGVGTFADVPWTYKWAAAYTAPVMCLADGAKYVAFCGRGAAGGEKIEVGGAGTTNTPITLTNAWKAYTVALPGDPNAGDNGVADPGFVWAATAAANAAAITFYIDKLQFVKDTPADNYCAPGSGSGGSGGTGGTGGGGTGGGGTGGTN